MSVEALEDPVGWWKLLPEFWSDMVLNIAHAVNTERGGEFIRHPWALLFQSCNGAPLGGRWRWKLDESSELLRRPRSTGQITQTPFLPKKNPPFQMGLEISSSGRLLPFSPRFAFLAVGISYSVTDEAKTWRHGDTACRGFGHLTVPCFDFCFNQRHLWDNPFPTWTPLMGFALAARFFSLKYTHKQLVGAASTECTPHCRTGRSPSENVTAVRRGLEEMRVLVENLTGRFLCVDVGEEGDGAAATVGVLKTGIAAASEEAVEEGRMILVTDHGRVMTDDRAALSQYGVREWSVVYVYFFPDGTTRWHRSYEDYITLGDDGDDQG